MSEIVLNCVTKQFGDHLAVKDLSFQVQRGTIFGLLGPNGAGKTTTMRMLTNIFPPDSGEILVLGEPPSPKLQRLIGYLPEERGLYRMMKIIDQLIFFAKLKGIHKKEARRRIEKWLTRFELFGWKDAKPHELSKGMQQKVQFLAAMIHDPQVLILDEPFTGLDPVSVELMKEIILNRKRRGKTIIFSTHQMEQVEQICDEICLIHNATMVLGGTLREVKQQYGRNTLLLDYGGPDEFLNGDLAGGLKRHANYVEIQLKDRADAQELLKQAVAGGASINRFELMEPSLNDIFIDKVRGRNGTSADHNSA